MKGKNTNLKPRFTKYETAPLSLLTAASVVTVIALSGCAPASDELVSSQGVKTEVQSVTAERNVQEFQLSPEFAGQTERFYIMDGCEINEGQKLMLEAVNDARAQSRFCGEEWKDAAGPLIWHCDLMAAAKVQSSDMATNNFFSHAGSDGLQVDQRVSAIGYNWRSVGENIAAGQDTVPQVIEDWLESPGHCMNIMNPQYQEFGSYRINITGSDHDSYWTQVFANPKS